MIFVQVTTPEELAEYPLGTVFCDAEGWWGCIDGKYPNPSIYSLEIIAFGTDYSFSEYQATYPVTVLSTPPSAKK